MTNRIFILTVTMLLIIMVVINEGKKKGKRKTKFGPKAISFNQSTTCDGFARNARFNPYSVLFQRWFVFYYWALPQPTKTYIFTFPSSNLTKKLHKIFDGKVSKPVNWTSRLVVMEGPRDDVSLLVERGDRGQYWQYYIHKVEKENIAPYNVRLKQTGDGRILGIMNCDLDTVYVMAKINEVPPKHKLQEEAARLGYRARRGKSYLYQGHEWMPIPEADDIDIWESPGPEDYDTKNDGLDSEYNHLKNVLIEELSDFTGPSQAKSAHDTNEQQFENSSKIYHNVSESNQTANISTTCQSIHISDEYISKNCASKTQLIDSSNMNEIIKLDGQQLNKEKYSTDNYKKQNAFNDIREVDYNSKKAPLNNMSNKSPSTIELKESTIDNLQEFTDVTIKLNTISESDENLHQLEVENKLSAQSTDSITLNDRKKAMEKLSINEKKSPTAEARISQT